MISRALLGLALALAAPLAAATPPNRVYGAWNSSAIGGGGYLQQVHFCPTDANRLYMSSDVGGLFRSDDRGATWRMVRGNLPSGGGAYEVRGLLVNPADADHVLIACGSPWGRAKGIFVTRDGGQTWKQTLDAMFPGNGDTRGQGRILMPSPADGKLLLAAADEGAFRSTDFGESWSAVPGLKNLFSPSDIVFDRGHPDRVWLCIAGWGTERTMGLFVSEDAGKSFRKLSETSPSEIVQDPADPTILYGLIDQRPVKSTDAAVTWTPFAEGLPPQSRDARSDGQYAAITVGRDFVLLGGHGGNFYRLRAGGAQWEKIRRERVDEGNWWGRMREGMYNHFGSALGYVAIDPRDENRWYFTDWYACYLSPDAGKSWKLAIDGVEMTVIHTVVQDPADEKVVHVGMADLGYFRSTDGGEKFSWINDGISNNIKSIATTPAKPGRLYAVGPKEWQWYANQVFISDDSGLHWRRSAMKGLPNMQESRCNTIVANPANADQAYLTVSGPIAPNQGGVYRSDDAGMSWTWIGQGIPQQDSFFRTDIWVHGPELAASRDGSLMAISCNRGQIARFDPAAGAWSPVASPAPGRGGPNALIADPSTASRFYLAMKEGGLFRSDDAGVTWTPLTNHDVHWVAVDLRNAQRLAATTGDGVIASSDGGKTWHELENSLPYRHPRNVVAIAGDRIVVGTGGNGVFWAPFPAGTSTAAVMQFIPATHRQIGYVGRFDTTDPAAPRFVWSASTVKIRFRGSAVNVMLDGGRDNRFLAVVDGKAGEPFYARGKRTISLATGLPDAEHAIEVMKITEPIFGPAAFYGFELDAKAQVLAAPPAGRKIEIIGDSISCGYGNEAASEKEHFTHSTQNAYLSYGAIAGRQLGADVHIIAWSGKLMAPNNTLPEIYDRAIPQEPSSRWMRGDWKPDAVLINLGTNDFAGGNPEGQMWVSAYKQFLTRIRQQYPQTTIFCAVGPMLSDAYSPSKTALSTCRRYLQRIVQESNAAGDTQVHFLEFPMQTGSNGFGADWHPSVKQHMAMADVLIAALEETLHWPAPAGSR